MKKLFTILVAFCALTCIQALAQIDSSLYEVVDSLVYVPKATFDKELAGKTIYQVMPSNVHVQEPADVKNAVQALIGRNASKTIEGYRVRIYFENKQSSREDSESEQKRFEAAFPGIQTYRTFQSPFFKVTVGDYRTRAEAQQALIRFQKQFPQAFIVKEQMKYPIIDVNDYYEVDTLKVLHLKVQ